MVNNTYFHYCSEQNNVEANYFEEHFFQTISKKGIDKKILIFSFAKSAFAAAKIFFEEVREIGKKVHMYSLL